jgi:hypothetical protein
MAPTVTSATRVLQSHSISLDLQSGKLVATGAEGTVSRLGQI